MQTQDYRDRNAQHKCISPRGANEVRHMAGHDLSTTPRYPDSHITVHCLCAVHALAWPAPQGEYSAVGVQIRRWGCEWYCRCFRGSNPMTYAKNTKHEASDEFALPVLGWASEWSSRKDSRLRFICILVALAVHQDDAHARFQCFCAHRPGTDLTREARGHLGPHVLQIYTSVIDGRPIRRDNAEERSISQLGSGFRIDATSPPPPPTTTVYIIPWAAICLP